MKKVQLAALALALSGAACATADGPKPAKVSNEFRLKDGTLVVCRMESDTGSNIRERVCRPVPGSNGTTSAGQDATVIQRPVQGLSGG